MPSISPLLIGGVGSYCADVILTKGVVELLSGGAIVSESRWVVALLVPALQVVGLDSAAAPAGLRQCLRPSARPAYHARQDAPCSKGAHMSKPKRPGRKPGSGTFSFRQASVPLRKRGITAASATPSPSKCKMAPSIILWYHPLHGFSSLSLIACPASLFAYDQTQRGHTSP